MRTLLLSAVVSGLVGSVTGSVAAQQTAPSANASRYHIAVVDVSYIFKKYSSFRSAMDAMKKEMETAESQLKSDRNAIQGKEEQAKQYDPSSAEFRQLDEDVARLKADFNLKAGRIKKDFLEREAKVYYQTYLQVNSAVKQYAQQHDIGLVLRFNGDQINPNRREDVLRGINDPIVNQNNIDITPDVLAILDRGGAAGGVAPAAAERQPVRR